MAKGKRFVKRSMNSDVVAEFGSLVWPIQAGGATAAASIGLNPTLFTTSRIATQWSEMYTQFRFRRLKIMYAGPSATDVAVGYVPGNVSTPPAAPSSVYELNNHSVNLSTVTVPTVFRIGSKSLMGDSPVKWYKTGQNGGTPDNLELQGYIVSASNVAADVTLYIDYDIEFCGRTVPSSVPKSLKDYTKLSADDQIVLLDYIDRKVALKSAGVLPQLN